MAKILKNAQDFEYIGINDCTSLYRNGSVVKLETLTDRRIQYLMDEDPYWQTIFRRIEQPKPAPVKSVATKTKKKKEESLPPGKEQVQD